MSTSSKPVNLTEAIQHLDTLPSMPVITQKILALNLNSDEGESAMLRLIERDPQIAAKIIGLANSPLFGSSKHVSSVADAAMLLGIIRQAGYPKAMVAQFGNCPRVTRHFPRDARKITPTRRRNIFGGPAA